MRAALEGFRSVRSGEPSKVLAVSVLTSFSPEEAEEIYGAPAQEAVLRFARKAVATAVKDVARPVDGLVCSIEELVMLRAMPEFDALELVVPGTRSTDVAVNDQKRTGTPEQAVCDGADMLVVGRQVTDAPKPIEAYRGFVAEVATGLMRRKRILAQPQ
jgi:orotidine-5'-phosphate decarboxylase